MKPGLARATPDRPMTPVPEAGPVSLSGVGFSVTQGERTARGLLSVGVGLGEALKACAEDLGMAEVIRLSGALAPDGLARMAALAEAQEAFGDKRAFGRACVEAGFHPACVALAVSSDARIAGMIGDFKVDTWLAGRLEGMGSHGSRLRLVPDDLSRLEAPLAVVACNLSLVRCSGREMSWLQEVGRYLHLESAKQLSFPNLERIEWDLDADFTRGCRFQKLKRVGSQVFAREVRDIDLPVLEEIGVGFFGFQTEGLVLPSLRKCGTLDVDRTESCAFPVLEEVQALYARGAQDLSLASLRVVTSGDIRTDATSDINAPRCPYFAK